MKQPLALAGILAVVDDSRTVPDLRRYYLSANEEAFTGAQFERLGGGGDRPEAANAITADDLIAVELHSVHVSPHRAIDLLQGQLGRDVAAELTKIPADVELDSDAASPLIADDGPAERAWRMLNQATGVGWVTAGKLLARKRPKLIPVYDGVVSCALGTGTGFWRWLHELLREDDRILARQLDARRREADLPAAISRLRILDVAVWMRHRNDHRDAACPGLRLP
ncbi:DUF6308 family protein [Micromonospora sp. CPCC 205539]|uniref:DUF6308 family protein n=1 Tax=Micromonospora sp. CPCC 205539 TaxID=3122408 RepID=UPI002FF0CFDE